MSALPPKADINHRERDVGFVPFCSVDNLAPIREARMNGHLCSTIMWSKSLNCRPPASDRLHKKCNILHKKGPLRGALCAKPGSLLAPDPVGDIAAERALGPCPSFVPKRT